MVVASNTVAITQTLDIAPVSSKELPDIQAAIECRFTQKYVGDMIIIQSSFTPFSIVSFADFELVNVLWVEIYAQVHCSDEECY